MEQSTGVLPLDSVPGHLGFQSQKWCSQSQDLPCQEKSLQKNRVYIAKADPQKQVALSKREQLQYDVAGWCKSQYKEKTP